MCYIFSTKGLQKLLLSAEYMDTRAGIPEAYHYFVERGILSENDFEKIIAGELYSRYLDVEYLREFYQKFKLPIGLICVSLDLHESWYFHVSDASPKGTFYFGSPATLYYIVGADDQLANPIDPEQIWAREDDQFDYY